MSNELELVDDQQGRALPAVQQNNQVRATGSDPGSVIRFMMDSGRDIDLDRLERLLQMQIEMEKREAQKAFVEAMAAFKAENVTVVRDKKNTQFNSQYASIGNLVGTVTPFLSKHGLSADWDLDDSSEKIKVSCNITHRLGGTKKVSLSSPPDNSGKKNALQEIKSAITYLRSITFEAACGIASEDGGADDDGNSFSRAEVDTSLADEYIAKLKVAKTDKEVLAIWNVGAAKMEKRPRDFKDFKDAVANRRGEINNPPQQEKK
jgi:hypothetical protein